MRILRLLAISAGIAAVASTSTSDPANARKLTFKECQALNLAAYKGGRVGHGQQGKYDAVANQCIKLYGRHLTTRGEMRARHGSSSAELLGDVLDVIGTSALSHGKKGKKKHH